MHRIEWGTLCPGLNPEFKYSLLLEIVLIELSILIISLFSSSTHSVS